VASAPDWSPSPTPGCSPAPSWCWTCWNWIGTWRGADLVLTAEGQIDGQTAQGKAPAAVAAHARAQGVPCIAIAGGIGEQIAPLHSAGMDAVFSLCRGPMSLDQARKQVEPLLADAAEQAVRAFFAGRRSV
jgi:glycerate kinase